MVRRVATLVWIDQRIGVSVSVKVFCVRSCKCCISMVNVGYYISYMQVNPSGILIQLVTPELS